MPSDPDETDDLFCALAAYLAEGREQTRCAEARALWQDRPIITLKETAMLMALRGGSLCVDALAHYLGRDVCSTQSLLDAMVGVGILERCGERYQASPATALYLQAVADGTLPR